MLIAFVAPSIVLLLLINLYPTIYAASESVRNGTLATVGRFIGFANYSSIFSSSAFWKAAEFTVIFSVVGVFGSWLAGLGIALLLRDRVAVPSVFKVLLLLPWIVPVVVSATSWNWLVATPESPLPQLAHFLGFHNALFLANPTLAKITVCVFKVWISFPFMMMMMSAALTSVDKNVYEAAQIDGASRWQTLRRLTLPLIARSTYISWILMTIFCVNDFPTIFLLTGGGPVGATTSLVVLAYQTVFEDLQTGTGISIAFIMTIALVLVSVFLYRQIRKVNIAE